MSLGWCFWTIWVTFKLIPFLTTFLTRSTTFSTLVQPLVQPNYLPTQGILDWCELPRHNLKSAAYEQAIRTDSRYITRRGSEGGRGIDHCMVDQELLQLISSSWIDPDSFHLCVSFSDHDAIITDININFDWEDGDIPDTVRTKYGQITAIPVKPKLAEESNDIIDIELDTKGKAEDELTETEQEQKKLLHTYRECFNHEKCQTFETTITTTGEQIEKTLTALSKAKPLQLTERTLELRNLINTYCTNLTKADTYAMEKTNLVRRISPNTSGYNTQDKKKPVEPTNKLYQKIRKVRTRLNKIDNKLRKTISILKEVITLDDMDTSESDTAAFKNIHRANRYIKWTRKKGPLTWCTSF